MASSSSSNPARAKAGEKVIIGGLAIQLVFFVLFIMVAAEFHRRMKRHPTSEALLPQCRWEYYLITLYGVSMLILVRSVFRVIEFVEGQAGYIVRHEAFLYGFDASTMLLVMAGLSWSHPGEIGALLRGKMSSDNGFELIQTSQRSKDSSVA